MFPGAAIFIFAGMALTPAHLEPGYHQMYDLNFAAAHSTFRGFPDDPLAVVSDAAAYLFSELDRLHVLESEFFTDDRAFLARGKLEPDPRSRQEFEAALDRAGRLTGAVLARSPNDTNALFARVLELGLRADYLGLIDKRYLASLGYLKEARAAAERLLSADAAYYDAYLAVGVENYMLSLKPAPVRWLLRIGGAQTDKDEGLAKLALTAEKGRLLAPYARLLLAVAALRDHNRGSARRILSELARTYPHNRLYALELERLR